MTTFGDGQVVPIRTPDALGQAIRRRRKERGWTQEDLAVRAVANRHLIMAIESGHDTRAIAAMFDTLAALGLELVVRERVSRGNGS